MKEFRLTIEVLTGPRVNFVVTLLDDSKAPRPTLACQGGFTLQEALNKIVPYVIEAYDDRNAPTLSE